MGLDVYLYRYADFEAYNELLNKSGDEGEDSIPSELQPQRIEHNSEIDPEHLFKIGYFRSSYNGSGINSILRNLDLDDLYSVFSPGNEYAFRPDWDEAANKICALIDELNKKMAAGEVLRTCSVSAEIGRAAPSSAHAVRLTIEALRKHSKSKSPFGSYSSSEGSFFLDDPLEVIAAVPVKHAFGGTDVELIYKYDASWELRALQIVAETIDFVRSQPDRDKYVLHWSS